MVGHFISELWTQLEAHLRSRRYNIRHPPAFNLQDGFHGQGSVRTQDPEEVSYTLPWTWTPWSRSRHLSYFFSITLSHSGIHFEMISTEPTIKLR